MKNRRSLPYLTLLFLIILGLFRRPLLMAIGDFLVVEEEDLRPADLIHALGGNFERLDYAIFLYQNGYAPRLFITGSDDAIAYRSYVIGRGVPAEDVAPASSQAINTYQEAQELKQFLGEESSVQSVIVVSSPYHMRRARWAFRRVLGERVRLQFAPVPFPVSPAARRWWTNPTTRKSVLSEYVKILYYRMRYRATVSEKKGSAIEKA